MKELRDIVENNCIQNKKLKSTEIIKKRLLTLYNDDADDNIENNIESIMNVSI